MHEDIAAILEEAARAPSGDNAQPWRAAVNDMTIELYNRPERDTSLYNWGNRAACAAHGAFLENLALAASARGYETDIKVFPDGASSAHTAMVRLRKGSPTRDPLAQAISKRATNRKPYRTEALSNDARDELERAAVSPGGTASVRFVYDRPAIETLAAAAAQNEAVLFGNRSLHNFFFGHINWSAKEDEEKKTGFPLSTLELPPPARALFPLWKRWPVMRLFSAIGFPSFIAKENAKLYASASCFAAITIENTSPESYLAAGRFLERLWLAATDQGLSMQPLTGIPFLHGRIAAGMKTDFSSSQIARIEDAYRTIAETLRVSGGTAVAFLARIGKSDPPSGRTSRVPLAALLAP